MRPRHLLPLLGLALLGGVAGRAQAPAPGAQPVAQAAWRAPVERFIGPTLRARIGEAMAEDAIPEGGPRKQPPSSFRPGPQRLVPDRIAADLKGLDAAGRRTASKSFQDLLSTYEQDAPKQDVAHALAFCLGICRQVARGSDLSQEETRDLARRAEARLPRLPEFAALSDRDRQAMYESLVITGGMVGGLARQGADPKDEAAARAAKAMARRVLELFGLPEP